MAETDVNRETELKLAVRPEDLGKLRDAPLLKSKGRAETRRMEAIYYDTPDHRLAQRLVTLRVRKQGDRYVQTIKSAPLAGSLSRGEWEWPVDGPRLDLSLVVDPDARAQLGIINEAELAPVFEARFDRTTRVLKGADGNGASIEVAVDEGEIRTGDGRVTPVCEVELELKEGDAKALFDMALELAKVAPLRVESRSKAARGYALAAGVADGPVKAEKLTLDPTVTVEGALCRIVRSCVNHFAANEACSLKGEDPEGIHQMRVALRRLRSALSLFRPFVPRDQYAWMVGEVRWLGRTFGPARDWDVFLTELYAPVREGLGGADGLAHSLVDDLEALEAAVRTRREQAYDKVRETILSQRYTDFQLKLGAWLEAKGWRAQAVNEESIRLFEPVERLAGQLLSKRHKKSRKAGQGFAELAPEPRHELRITLKKLRYAAEFFRTLYEDKASRRYIQQLAAFQDALGHLNDVATATRLLHELHADESAPAGKGEERAAGLIIGWHARGVKDLEPVLVSHWDSFAGAKPFWSKRGAMA